MGDLEVAEAAEDEFPGAGGDAVTCERGDADAGEGAVGTCSGGVGKGVMFLWPAVVFIVSDC